MITWAWVALTLLGCLEMMGFFRGPYTLVSARPPLERAMFYIGLGFEALLVYGLVKTIRGTWS